MGPFKAAKYCQYTVWHNVYFMVFGKPIKYVTHKNDLVLDSASISAIVILQHYHIYPTWEKRIEIFD